MITSKVWGMKEALAGIDGSGDRLEKILKKAMTEGGKAAARAMKGKTPKRWVKLVRYKVGKALTEGSTVRIGYYGTRGAKTRTREIPDFFKAYWKNHGTLSRRDPEHKFDYPVKPNVVRRNDVGQYPEKFFEEAIRGIEEVFVDKVEEVLNANKDNILMP